MSNSSQARRNMGGESQPRAMIHKKILDIARSNPDASLESIAGEVSGASAVFVERVLEEYGDPAADASTRERTDGKGNNQLKSEDRTESDASHSSANESAGQSSDSGKGHSAGGGGETTQRDRPEAMSESKKESAGTTDTPSNSDSSARPELLNSTQESETNSVDKTEKDQSESEVVTDPSELSDKQRETLRTVQQEPAATQEEIADTLGVTRATISKRLNDIAGFNWKTRRDFVNTLFDDGMSDNNEPEVAEQTPSSKVRELESRIDELETRLEATSDSDTESPLDAELTHKVIHSCMKADYLSEEEELQLLQELL